MKKICPICGKTFETLPKGESRKYCFECSPHYDKNSNLGRSKTITAIRRALKKRLVAEKGGKCEICGYDKCIEALEFHHLNPAEKEFNISDFCGKKTVDIALALQELEKCQLVCANCHREIHSIEDSN